MRQATRILTFTCAAVAAAFSQTGRVSGPVTGYVYDAHSRGMRPVLGLPGASLLGERMGFGFDVKAVTVSPRLDGAIATAADGGTHFLRIDDGVMTEAPAGDIGANAQSVVFSPGGGAAALYAGNSVQVVTGLPGSPKLRSTISLGSLAAR